MLAPKLLRKDLLEEVSVLVAPVSPSSLGDAVREACAQLGARVCMCASDPADAQALDRAIAEAGELDMLVFDGAELFGRRGLSACLDSAWNATRAVINLVFLPAARAGRIVYLAPPPDAGEHADAARAGLENLARTLSVEWARHHVTVVTLALGATTAPGEAAALTAYLASPAGAYFSGCLLDLRGV